MTTMWLVMVLAFAEPGALAEDGGPLKAVHTPNAATALNQSSRRASECASGVSYDFGSFRCTEASHSKEPDPSNCCMKCTLATGVNCADSAAGCCESTSGNACLHSTCEKCLSGHAMLDGCPEGLIQRDGSACCEASCENPCPAGKACTAKDTCTDIPIDNCMEMHMDTGLCKACGQGFRVDRSKNPWDCKACPSGQLTPTDQNPNRKKNGCPYGYFFDTTTECCAACPGTGQACLDFASNSLDFTKDGAKLGCCATGNICKKSSESMGTCLASFCTSGDYCRSNFASGICPLESGEIENDCSTPYCLDGLCVEKALNCATTGVKPNDGACPQGHFFYKGCEDCLACPATLTSNTESEPCSACSDRKRVFDVATFTCLTCGVKCSDNSEKNCNACNGCLSNGATCDACESGHSWVCWDGDPLLNKCKIIRPGWACPSGFGAAMIDSDTGGCCTACPVGTNCHDNSHCSSGTICKRSDSAICGTCAIGNANEAVTEAASVFLVLLCYLVSAQ